jgi:hypothetical protein
MVVGGGGGGLGRGGGRGGRTRARWRAGARPRTAVCRLPPARSGPVPAPPAEPRRAQRRGERATRSERARAGRGWGGGRRQTAIFSNFQLFEPSSLISFHQRSPTYNAFRVIGTIPGGVATKHERIRETLSGISRRHQMHRSPDAPQTRRARREMSRAAARRPGTHEQAAGDVLDGPEVHGEQRDADDEAQHEALGEPGAEHVGEQRRRLEEHVDCRPRAPVRHKCVPSQYAGPRTQLGSVACKPERLYIGAEARGREGAETGVSQKAT